MYLFYNILCVFCFIVCLFCFIVYEFYFSVYFVGDNVKGIVFNYIDENFIYVGVYIVDFFND